MIDVDFEAPHPQLEIMGTRGQSGRYYMPWKPSDELKEWLVQNCRGAYIATPLIEMSFEQGIGELPMFHGIKFIFEDHQEAMLFKLTWA